MLRRRGYKIFTVGVEECTRERVLSSIDELAHDSRDGSKTFFYYAGHGSHIDRTYVNGITTRGEGYVDSQRIVPYALFERLANVRGKKAVVIDACYSGEFTEYLRKGMGPPLLKDYVVIASTRRDGEGIVTVWTTKPEEVPRHLIDKSVSNVVFWLYGRTPHRRRVDLSQIPIPIFNALPDVRTRYPKTNLEIQRVSDTGFIL